MKSFTNLNKKSFSVEEMTMGEKENNVVHEHGEKLFFDYLMDQRRESYLNHDSDYDTAFMTI